MTNEKDEELAARNFLEQQHRFRGLISEFKSRRFVEKPSMPRERRFRSQAAELLLDIRAKLNPEQYRPFLEWVQEQVDGQLRELAATPIRYDELSGVHFAPALPLDNELFWITERIRIERERISTFLLAKARIQHLSLSGKYEDAITAIEMVQAVLGVTLWTVQLRLALEHQAGGLERQKRYSAEVRAVYRSGLLGFVTYHTSVRNEDRTTLAKFLDDIEGRIENHPYFEDATKTYVRYRLKHEFPATHGGFAEILRVEQSHGVLDIYETFVAVLQELSSRKLDARHTKLILDCIRGVGISDFRLIKIGRLLDPNFPVSLPARDEQASNLLLAEAPAKAALKARSVLRQSGHADPWQIIYSGFALAHGIRPRKVETPSPSTIAQMIGRVQSRCEASVDAWAQTAKLCLNILGLPVAAGVFQFLGQIKRSVPDADWQPWLIGLNSPNYGIEDCPWVPPCNVPASPTSDQATHAMWLEAINPKASNSSKPALLAEALGLIAQLQFKRAIDILAGDDDGWPEPLRSLRTLALLHAYYARGERQQVVTLVASEGSRSAAHRQFVPVVGSLKNYVWADFKAVEAPLAAPIALHLLWSATETGSTASQLRFATGAALRKIGVSRPSELSTEIAKCTPRELIYFLRYVCVPDVLDLSRLFKSTREIMEERIAICALLENLDPVNAAAYGDEVVLITSQLALDEGHWIVDSTRIHVDADALVRWATRELSEDYERYRDLAVVSVDGPQSFEDVLRELRDSASQKTAFSPDNEADAVLISLVKRMGEEFLVNATFGLDFYLSKRVRHQSFIGLIRGPLEFAGLITTRGSEAGEYHRNDAWVDRFQRIDAEGRDRVDAALRRFAHSFDEILTSAKDTYFHLRSAECPQGLLMLTLNDRLLSVVKAMTRLDLSAQEFHRIMVTLLWAALEPALEAVQTLISGDMKSEISKEFDTVRASVRTIAEQDPTFLEFDAAMGRVSAEVQVKLDEAAQWFVHAPTLASRRTFTLPQILRVGLDAALRTQRNYSPQISQSTEGEIELLSSDLVFVSDVLFVGLGNVQKHSGLTAPKIDVSARWDEGASTLTLAVVSDCRPSNRQEKSKQADAIRKLIEADGHSPRTRTEGGSGFAKLAAVTGQSEKAKIEFGFTPEGRFRLEVTYAVVLQNTDVADAA